MADLVYRDVKGAKLTKEEGDLNLRAINNELVTATSKTTPHPYYHFHGYAGGQTIDDSQFIDMSGINHAFRGANLSVSQLWTTNAGYASTIDPASGTGDSVLRIPNLNFDYAGGEKLIIWWLGKVTAEGATARMMGDGYGTTAGQWGFRVHLGADGKIQFVINDAAELYSSIPSVSISGRLASFAIALDGQGKRFGMWIDEAYMLSEGTYTSFGASAIDTRNSNTFNIGTSFAAGAGSSGIATATRALAILRLPTGYTMPSVGTLTSVFQQLRSNPGKLILAGAF